MVKIRAYIKLYLGGRKTPFFTGYRPLFTFIEGMKTSGSIDLIGRDKFFPGDEGEVDITFLHVEYLGEDFKEGKRFAFSEGSESLGEGIVKHIII
ncbi:hypothetical protein [Chitinophaga filiformis]|uniref:Translation elongation factor EFTu/EF1A C-terminal domain-containing protein n=1 Tax=Chitinophaga filiformis TaxID=104663 RepID=A0ABY4HZR1_CHIFI|nr:hypothetical protein [Chitinophaga filiformis]UPK67936.1 hypothetical protein MYF79_23575 [Chitinophaga filiformis]